MLVTDRCLGLDPAISSKPRWLGTRSGISTNFPSSIFFINSDGTGGMAEPTVKDVGDWVVGRRTFFRLDQSTLMCSRSSKCERK